MTKFPRVLIVGTLPYDPNESSRALDTYFHNWPKENLRMIFSNSNMPIKGHCGSLYQITDYDVLQRFLKKKKECGRIINYSDLSDNKVVEGENKLSKFKRKTILRYYARKILWSKKRWLTENLIKWVDEFKPEAIYICFSDDYFILDISRYFSDKYNIPVIAQIGDDYYFKRYDLFLKPYIKSYKRLFDNIMSREGFGVYISDKLAHKYNGSFKLQGIPFYLSSAIKQSSKEVKFEFNYIGKLNLGRFKSLAILGDALHSIDCKYHINIYSQDDGKKFTKHLEKHNCVFKGKIDYSKATEIMNSGAFNIIASSFSKKDINGSRYSLSTKITDSLASSGPILAIGPNGDGAIDFLKDKKCSIVIDSQKLDIKDLREKLFDEKALEEKIKKAHAISSDLFSAEKNRLKFEDNCRSIVKGR